MSIHYRSDDALVWHGDSLDLMRELDDGCMDAVVTDPPYGLEFMGKDWDSFGSDTASRGNSGATFANGTVGGFDGKPMPRYGKRWVQRRCTVCGRTDAGGSPCQCDNPNWNITHEAGTPRFAKAFQAWCEEWATEAYRLLKPGGHLLAFGGTRTFHRLTAGIEDAGFEIRDSIAWLYGSGFPKSLDVSKAIDKAAGAEREAGALAGRTGGGRKSMNDAPGNGRAKDYLAGDYFDSAPATADAARWNGWGTALKPAFEPIVVARKPLTGTVAANVLAYGTGALNIDGSRIGTDWATDPNARGWQGGNSKHEGTVNFGAGGKDRVARPHEGGRWPANVVLDASQAAALDQQSGIQKDGVAVNRNRSGEKPNTIYGKFAESNAPDQGFGGSGGASRFFYVAKAPARERPKVYHQACDCETVKPWQSPPRDTTASKSDDGRSWNTSTSGKKRKGGKSRPGMTSTTGTGTSSTTGSGISNSSPASNTSASTADANSETASGGSLAASAGSSSPSASPTGTSARRGGRSTADVGPATSGRSSSPNVCAVCGTPFRVEAHATIKPLTLMRHLVKLVTPPGGIVLDPFAGSGTTVEACLLEGFRCMAMEREADYLPLIVHRIERADCLTPPPARRRDPAPCR